MILISYPWKKKKKIDPLDVRSRRAPPCFVWWSMNYYRRMSMLITATLWWSVDPRPSNKIVRITCSSPVPLIDFFIESSMTIVLRNLFVVPPSRPRVHPPEHKLLSAPNTHDWAIAARSVYDHRSRLIRGCVNYIRDTHNKLILNSRVVRKNIFRVWENRWFSVQIVLSIEIVNRSYLMRQRITRHVSWHGFR